jgi:hypothetical protein
MTSGEATILPVKFSDVDLARLTSRAEPQRDLTIHLVALSAPAWG